MTSVWLTPEAHARLQAELTSLRTPAVPGGDLDDSHARANRVRQLQDLLANAVVGEDPPNDGVAEPGMVLTVRYDDTADEETFLLGLRTTEQDDDLEVFSPTSPLGKALIGARPGDRRSYQVPNGTTVPVTLLRAIPYGQHRLQPATG